jgi:hypothetical protein
LRQKWRGRRRLLPARLRELCRVESEIRGWAVVFEDFVGDDFRNLSKKEMLVHKRSQTLTWSITFTCGLFTGGCAPAQPHPAVAIAPDEARSAQAAQRRTASTEPEVRVLFVGNSLTSSNDLPGMVRALAAAGGKRLAYHCDTPDGFNLDDHWPPGRPFELLARERWDYLVLQQGPSTRLESRRQLAASAKRFSDAAVAAGVTPAVYGVWPMQNQPNGFDLACSSYREAAIAADAVFCPVGEAWRAALLLDPPIALYQSDGLHPTQAGSYLAALVIVEQLVDVKPDGLPNRLHLDAGLVVELPDTDAERLQRIAAQSSARHGIKRVRLPQ